MLRMTRTGFLAALGGAGFAQEKKKVYKPLDSEQDTGNRAYDRLVREIRHELIMLPYISVFDNLSFMVDGYNVTLMGSVTRPTSKSSAENVVKKIEGVEKVDNKIEVLPLSPQDDRIRVMAARVVFGHSSLNRYALQAVPPIRIIVKNGDLTLEGIVANEGDKNIAGIEANSVPGVFKVTNNLRLEPRK